MYCYSSISLGLLFTTTYIVSCLVNLPYFLDSFINNFFLLGLIAAAYSSADSALTSLTTSFCVDFLNIEKREPSSQTSIRKRAHILISILLVIVIIAFKYLLDSSVIDLLLKAASYTYGPLLGLFAFGIFTKMQIKDHLVWIVALVSVVTTFILGNLPPEYLGGYVFNYELLIVNGAQSGLYFGNN